MGECLPSRYRDHASWPVVSGASHGRPGTIKEWATSVPRACTGNVPTPSCTAAITNEKTGFSHLQLTHSLIPTALATSWPGATGQGEETPPKGVLPHALLAKAARPSPSAAVRQPRYKARGTVSCQLS